MTTGVLEAREIRKSYHRRKVLRGVDLSVLPGQHLRYFAAARLGLLLGVVVRSDLEGFLPAALATAGLIIFSVRTRVR